jgi:nucleoside-diphosphate-sugar epimerase
MRALVTGATGFIGPHLVRRLAQRGDEVTCLVRPTSNLAALAPWPVRFVPGDITDLANLETAVAGCDVVFHLAGVTTALRRADMFRVNADGVANVAQACATRLTPPKLILVSSLAASRPARDGRAVCESDDPAPVSTYGRSKRAGELAAEKHAASVPITIIRPPIVFGEGDRALLPLFEGIARWGVHLVPGYFEKRFSLIHADDLANALLLAVERGARLAGEQRPSAQGVYFVAADESPSYAEIGRMVGAALGRRRVMVVRQAHFAVWSIAAATQTLGWLRRRPFAFNWDKAREATAGSWLCSAERFQRDTGFSPAASIADRLQQTAQWYQEQGWLPAGRSELQEVAASARNNPPQAPLR